LREDRDLSGPRRRRCPGDSFLRVYQGYRALGSTPAATALSVDSQDLEMLALLDREIVRRLRMVS